MITNSSSRRVHLYNTGSAAATIRIDQTATAVGGELSKGHRSPPKTSLSRLGSPRLASPTTPSVQPMPPMATTTATDSAARRFAMACGVLSQYVKASGVTVPMASGATERVLGAAAQEPGSPADGAQQLTIFYGGRVVVLDGCTPARAAELIRFAAAAASQGAPAQAPAPTFVDMPIARKASLQRFLSKRKDRSAPEGPPYAHREEEAPPPPPAKKGKTEASSWLALGSLGDMHAK